QFNTIGVDGDGSAGEANEGNLISGNLGPGIDSHSSAAENVVAGNLVGLTATGDAALPNGIDGVRIYHSAQDNLVGTNADGISDHLERNVIVAGPDTGVRLFGQVGEPSGNVIAGNYIGTDVTGTVDLTDGVGIRLELGAHDNLVG